jgi:hypothetical protein
MRDEHRMVGSRLVEILSVVLAVFAHPGVVVLETQHPFTGRGFGGALLDWSQS